MLKYRDRERGMDYLGGSYQNKTDLLLLPPPVDLINEITRTFLDHSPALLPFWFH